jgi:Tfp pilus assembly protein PilO
MTGAELTSQIKKKPVVAVCVLVAIGCGVFYYFRSSAIDESKALLETKAKESSAMVANVRNADKLPVQTEALKKATTALEGRLVKSSQLATNLQYFYRLESDTGVKLTDVRQNQYGRANNSLYIGIPYSVTIQGSYVQVLDFIQRIEAGRHFSKFATISFNKAASGDSGGNQISASMNIELLGLP